jgi:phosphoglycerate kinase
MKTLDEAELKGKTVLLRVDINVPYDPEAKRIADSPRLREHAKTIKELAERGAKVVILAHQGRRGEQDFVPLEQHASLLSKHVGREIKYINETIGERAKQTIRNLKEGEILLLENVRFLDEETLNISSEEHSKGKLVRELVPLADLFVNDAFSAAHRSHASLVGFAKVLPAFAGRVMEREILALEKVSKAKALLALGGAKVDDCLAIMEHFFKQERVELVLTSGVLCELCLIAKGYELGDPTLEFLQKKGFLGLIPRVEKVLEEQEDKIRIPLDVAIEIEGERVEIDVDHLPVNYQILDIGKRTAESYAKPIAKAKVIVMKGPAGVYEKKGFELGTKLLLEAIASAKGYSLIGGGDTLLALEKVGIERKNFSHVSLGGGALITYLAGKLMPAIEVLKT